MTWAEVASDSIKIVVPSLLTALTAFFVVRSSRSLEFDKERWRRKQNFLERLGEQFDRVESAILDLRISYGTFDRAKFKNPMFPCDTEEKLALLLANCHEEEQKLKSFDAGLWMFGFDQCLNVLYGYQYLLSVLHEAMQMTKVGQNRDVSGTANSLSEEAHKFRKALAATYQSKPQPGLQHRQDTSYKLGHER